MTPFGTLLRHTLDVPLRISEILALAFLASWLLPQRDDRDGPRIPLPMALAGWLLGLSLIASIAILILRLQPYPGELKETVHLLRIGYFLFTERIGVVAAMQLVEGFALVVATVFALRHRPRLAVWLPIALCAGGAAAATTSLLIWRGIGPTALVEHLSRLGYRVAHISDLNAAGSYFAMLLCLALGDVAACCRLAAVRLGGAGCDERHGPVVFGIAQCLRRIDDRDRARDRLVPHGVVEQASAPDGAGGAPDRSERARVSCVRSCSSAIPPSAAAVSGSSSMRRARG